jgi:hypothetical protein
MTGYDTYITFLALKRHFTSDYDYHKYNGKVNCSLSTYKKDQKNYYFCERLARKYDHDTVVDFFLASFVMSESPDKVWFGSIVRNGEKTYKEWLYRLEHMEQRFESDIHNLLEESGNFKDIFTTNHRHPLILKRYLSGEMSPETMVVLDTLTEFCDILDSELKDSIWKNTYKFIRNYRTFLRFSKTDYKKVLAHVVSTFKDSSG